MEPAEEVKKEMHRSSIARNWCSKAKITETKFKWIIDGDFQRDAEAKIEFGDSVQKELEQIVRGRRRTKAEGRQVTDEDSLKGQ